MFGGFGKYKMMEELEMQSKKEIEEEKKTFTPRRRKKEKRKGREAISLIPRMVIF
jgi:hypothetical protein